MTTKKEVVEKRKKLNSLQEKKHYFNKGDRRVKTPRICVICGKPLSSLIISKNEYVTSESHTRIHLNDFFIVDICKDVKSCYRELENRGEML